jgi:hypothetical protein
MKTRIFEQTEEGYDIGAGDCHCNIRRLNIQLDSENLEIHGG